MTRWRAAVGGSVLAVLLALAMAAPAGAAPSLSLSASTAAAGADLTVVGSGWAPGALVTIEVCGNGGRDLTSDCDVAGSKQVGVRDDGGLSLLLRVTNPPRPCPCVVRASTAGSEVTAPIELIGVPVAPPVTTPQPADTRLVRIEGLRVDGERALAAWFGGGSRRRVELTVRNVSEVPVDRAVLSVLVGKHRPLTDIQAAPDLPSLAPGASQRFVVPIAVDGPVAGRYTIEARIIGAGQVTAADVRLTSYPWGAIVVLLLAGQLGLVLVRNRLRRHLDAQDRAGDVVVDLRERAPVLDLPPLIDLRDPPAASPLDGISIPWSGRPRSPVRSGAVALGADGWVTGGQEPRGAPQLWLPPSARSARSRQATPV